MMTEAEIIDLAHRWVNLQLAPQDSPEAKELMRAAVQVNTLAIRQPMECWSVVMKVFCETNDEWVLTNLAAGPIESLLVRHAEKIIPLLESEAVRSERFRHMLQGVWKNLIPEDIWRRLQTVRSR
jgi:hypothetical protein